MRNYMSAALMKRPTLLSALFNPDDWQFEAAEANAQSNSVRWNTLAKLAFGSFWDDDEDQWQAKPFAYSNGIAMIPVSGVLLNRCNWSFPGYVTGYNAIRTQTDAALADSQVQGIVYDVDSPGGMVQGCFELSDHLYSVRDGKPSVAVIDGDCCSAAYAIGSSIGKMIATRSANVGSIGVRTMHVDVSKALDKAGVNITHIYSGKHKIDGAPTEPLSKDVKAQMQAECDTIYEEFVSTVARNRGIDAQVPRDTEAQVYNASDAKDLGLIDAVSTPQEAMTAFHSELSGSPTNIGVAMNQTVKQPAAVEPAVDTAAIEATAKAEATTAERTRIAAILGCDEAKDRTELAHHLAFGTEMTADAAKGILGKASKSVAAAAVADPKAPAAQRANPFESAMNTTENPNISAGPGTEVQEDPVARILKNHTQATGFKPKAA